MQLCCSRKSSPHDRHPSPMTKSSKRASRAPKSRVANRRATKGRATQRKTGPNRKSTELKLAELKERLLKISDLRAANSLLELGSRHLHAPGRRPCARYGKARRWDGSPTRGRSIRRWAGSLTGSRPTPIACSYDSDDASLIRVARRDFEKKIKVPADTWRVSTRSARPPTTPGPGRGRRTTLPPWCPSSNRRSSTAANTQNSSRPTSTSPTRSSTTPKKA